MEGKFLNLLMIKLTLLLIVLFSSLTFCQEKKTDNILIINYDHILHLEGMPQATKINATLLSNSESAIYEMDFLNNSGFVEKVEDKSGDMLYSIKPSKNPVIYKTLKKGIFFSKERIMSNFYLVEDNVGIFEWSLKNNFKDILGYKCQEAQVNYRGRTYKAFFTTKIPFSTGPWKFGGLPGAILRVESQDGVFSMTANSLEIKNEKSNIKFPFSNEKAISWDDYIKIYDKKYRELLHYRDENGGTITIPRRNIETFISH